MTTLQRDALQRIARLVLLGSAARPGSGNWNPALCCTWTYDGRGKLGVICSDGEAHLLTVIALDGDTSPFTVVLDAEVFVKASHGFKVGGSITVHVHKKVVGLQQGLRYLPVPRRDSLAASPCLLPGASEKLLDLSSLQQMVMAATCGERSQLTRDDPNDHRQAVCGLFSDGCAMGADQGTILVCQGPPLGFDVSLSRRHGKQLTQWLRFVRASYGAAGEIRLRLLHGLDGKPVATSFQCQEHEDRIILPYRRPEFRRLPVDRVMQHAKAFQSVRLRKRVLLKAVRTLAQFDRILVVRFPSEGGTPPEVMISTRCTPPAYERMPVSSANEQAVEAEISVTAKDLILAAHAVAGESLEIELLANRHLCLTGASERVRLLPTRALVRPANQVGTVTEHPVAEQR